MDRYSVENRKYPENTQKVPIGVLWGSPWKNAQKIHLGILKIVKIYSNSTPGSIWGVFVDYLESFVFAPPNDRGHGLPWSNGVVLLLA